MIVITYPQKKAKPWHTKDPLEPSWDWVPFRVRDWSFDLGEQVDILEFLNYTVHGARATSKEGEEYVIEYDYYERR